LKPLFADSEFYGPGKTKGLTNSLILKILKTKEPKVFLKDTVLRTLIFTPDASKAMALIGNLIPMKTWHLPCTTID
jgi:hypothetical protein